MPARLSIDETRATIITIGITTIRHLLFAMRCLTIYEEFSRALLC